MRDGLVGVGEQQPVATPDARVRVGQSVDQRVRAAASLRRRRGDTVELNAGNGFERRVAHDFLPLSIASPATKTIASERDAKSYEIEAHTRPTVPW